MKIFYKLSLGVFVVAFIFNFIGPIFAHASESAVNLGTSGNYEVLAKTAVTTTGTTIIVGDIGISPAFAGDTTGFGPVLDSTGCFSTTVPTTLVTGKIYAADYNTGSCTTPSVLTTAVLDMQNAYTDAVGRAPTSAATTNVGAGTLTDLTLTSGVYEWGTSVTIPTDLTLTGSATDIWIFKVAGTLDISANKKITLTGGALPQNIFWQVSGAVTLEPGSHFEGNILAQTNIAMQTGATLNGKALAQTAVTLDSNIIKTNASVVTPISVLSPMNFAGVGVSDTGYSWRDRIHYTLWAYVGAPGSRTYSSVPATTTVTSWLLTFRSRLNWDLDNSVDGYVLQSDVDTTGSVGPGVYSWIDLGKVSTFTDDASQSSWTHGQFTASQTPFVWVPTISGITIASRPSKLSYFIGNTLDISGLSVFSTYSDNSTTTETVNASNISGFDSSTVGTKTVTVTVSGKTATFRVIVSTPVSENTPAVVSSGGGNFSSGGTGFVSTTTTPIITTAPVGQVLGVSIFRFSSYLRRGMSNENIIELQNRLRREGYFTYPTTTGYFGSFTFSTVKAYQGEHGLPETGFVGPLTIAELNK